MKRTVVIITVLAIFVMILAPVISEARGGYHHRPHYRPYYGGWGYGGAAIGGFVAGAIVGSAFRPAPVYVYPAPPPPPPRVYYYYPPPPGAYAYPY